MKFFIKDFFSKFDQIRSFLRIWSHLLKKSLMENFIFCTVSTNQSLCNYIYHVIQCHCRRQKNYTLSSWYKLSTKQESRWLCCLFDSNNNGTDFFLITYDISLPWDHVFKTHNLVLISWCWYANLQLYHFLLLESFWNWR